MVALKTGQTHVHNYLRPLLERIMRGDIGPSFVVTHTLRLDDAPRGYKMFKHKDDSCIHGCRRSKRPQAYHTSQTTRIQQRHHAKHN